MPVVIEQRVELTGSPGAVFAFLTDPARRPGWDAAGRHDLQLVRYPTRQHQ